MGFIHKIHVVCLFSLILKVWHAECNTQQLSCSVEELGVKTPWNPKVPDKGEEPQVCFYTEKTCCTRQTEESLRIKAAKIMKNQLQIRYMAAKKDMLSLFDDLKGHFHSLMEEGNRQSISFLMGKQPNLTAKEVSAVSTLFQDLENYFADDKEDLEEIVNKFLRNSFSMLFKYLKPGGNTLSAKYRQCLKDNIDKIKPFGTHPAALVGRFERVFEPVRGLFKGLKFGVQIMHMAQHFNITEECRNGLVEMKFCSLCQGLTQVKPCYGFCMDITRNCLLSEIQLQSKWRQFTEIVQLLMERVGNSELENYLTSIHKDFWVAAEYMLSQEANLTPQVLKECGQPTYDDVKTSPYKQPVSPTPHVKLRLFAKMNAARKKLSNLTLFFQELPQELCVSDGLGAEEKIIDSCWNGTSVARYESKQNDSWLSPESKNHLTLLKRKIHDKIAMMEKAILRKDDEDELDGSSSGNEISGCNDDDEDCGSTSSGEKLNVNVIGEEEDFDFIKTPASINIIGNNSQAGGVDPKTNHKSGDVLAQGKSSSLGVTWLQVLTLLLLVWLTRG